jgi:hypothetical protein
MNELAQEPVCAKSRRNPVSQGEFIVYAEKSTPTADPTVHREASNQRERNVLTSSSDSYQKILDYHIVEILLTTVLFGVIILIRLHR